MLANVMLVTTSGDGTCTSSPLSSCCAKQETKPSSLGVALVFSGPVVVCALTFYSHFARKEWFPQCCCGDKGARIARAVAFVLLDTLPWSLGMLFLEAEAAPLFTPCLTNPVVRLDWFRTVSAVCMSEIALSPFVPHLRKGNISAVIHALMVSVQLSVVGLSMYLSALRMTSLPAAAWLAYFSTVMFPIVFATSLHIVYWLLTGRAFLGFNLNILELAPALPTVDLNVEELKLPVVAIGDILRGEWTGRSAATSVRDLVSHLERAAERAELPASSLWRLEESVARVQPFATASGPLTAAEAFALASYLVGASTFVVAIDEILCSTRHEARAKEWWKSYHLAEVDGGCSSTVRVLQVLLRSMDKLPPVRASQRVAYRTMQTSSTVLQHYSGAVGSRVSWSRPVRVSATAARVGGGTNLVLSVPLEVCRDTMYVCDGAPVWVVPPDVRFTVKSVTLGMGGVVIVKLGAESTSHCVAPRSTSVTLNPLELPLLLDSDL